MPTHNLQFSIQEQETKRAVVPMKAVTFKNNIMGIERVVKAPDVEIEGVSSYRLHYFKNLSQRHNPFNKRHSDVVGIKRESKILYNKIGRADIEYTQIRNSVESFSPFHNNKTASPTEMLNARHSAHESQRGNRKMSPHGSERRGSRAASPPSQLQLSQLNNEDFTRSVGLKDYAETPNRGQSKSQISLIKPNSVDIQVGKETSVGTAAHAERQERNAAAAINSATINAVMEKEQFASVDSPAHHKMTHASADFFPGNSTKDKQETVSPNLKANSVLDTIPVADSEMAKIERSPSDFGDHSKARSSDIDVNEVQAITKS